MSRGIDFSALTRAERIVLVAGTVGFVNGLIPWWYRVSTAARTSGYNAGLTGWGVIAVASCLAASLATLGRATLWPRPAPQWDGVAYLVLGMFSVDAIAAQTNTQAGHQWIGIYIGFAAGLALALGGLLRRRERTRGWV